MFGYGDNAAKQIDAARPVDTRQDSPVDADLSDMGCLVPRDCTKPSQPFCGLFCSPGGACYTLCSVPGALSLKAICNPADGPQCTTSNGGAGMCTDVVPSTYSPMHYNVCE